MLGMAAFFGAIAAACLAYARSRFAQPGSRWQWFNSGVSPRGNEIIALIMLLACGVLALAGLWLVIVN
jgi:hypothetical protein